MRIKRILSSRGVWLTFEMNPLPMAEFLDRSRQNRIGSSYLSMSSFYDTKKGETVWEEKGLSGYGIYQAGGNQEEERELGIRAAFAILVKDIVDRTAVGGW